MRETPSSRAACVMLRPTRFSVRQITSRSAVVRAVFSASNTVSNIGNYATNNGNVNGDLVTQTTLDFGNLTSLTPAQAAQLSEQMRALNLVQTGPGNIVDPSVNPGAGGTIVQNTLNNQHISNQTIINASSNAMSTIKGMNSMATITDGLSRGLGH